MKEKIILCPCGKEFTALTTKSALCPDCKKIHNKNYHKIYNKNYKASDAHKKQNKRKYTRTVLKNKPKQDIDIYTEYCKNNWDTVKGCLNCICPECIQQTENDTILPWEEEGFYADKVYIDNSIERYLG